MKKLQANDYKNENRPNNVDLVDGKNVNAQNANAAEYDCGDCNKKQAAEKTDKCKREIDIGNKTDVSDDKSAKSDNNKVLNAIKKICSRWFIQAFSGMAQGLFVTLIAGTIIKTLGTYVFGNNVVGNFLVMLGTFASVITGCGIGVGIAYGLKTDKLVVFSAAVAGFLGAYADKIIAGQTFAEITAVLAKGNPGNPVSAYICSLLATEVGNLVAGKTKLDILVVPLTCIFSAAIGIYVSYPFILLIGLISDGIGIATKANPFVMGVVISVIMGILLTLPTSSAAIWVSIAGIYGSAAPDEILLAGGAAVVGCACHMVGFAVMSFKENGFGGIISQGLGTSMLQIPNVMRKPSLFIPPVIASAIAGPLATCVFKLRCNAAGGGMGTSGLVGIFGVIDASSGVISPFMMWLGIALLMIGIPAVVCYFVSEFMRKKGFIKDGDLKIR